MRADGQKMVLGCIVDSYGGHQAAWLSTDLTECGGKDPANDVNHYVRFAQKCEAAMMDFAFVTDFPSIPDGTADQVSRSPLSSNVFEPVTILTAMVCATSHIAIVGTISTSYYEPYNVARLIASVDHISHGRAGWNVVTTRNRVASVNFGKDDLDDHAVRYERASEFVDVVRGLWDTWEDDAIVFDKENKRYFDPDKVHKLNHKGKHYSVQGPLNISRPPQGWPLITQAGGSEPGKELAARTADVVFIQAPTIEVAKEFYDDLKARLPKYGRKPEDLKIVCGIIIVVGEDEADAQAKSDLVSRHISEETGRQIITGVLDVDLSDLDYDAPIPLDRLIEQSNKGQTYFKNLRGFIEQGLTFRQIASRFAEARVGSMVKGSVQQVADHMQTWFEAGACDGFMMRGLSVQANLDDICDQVIPELRRRGFARTEYAGATARENLGLPRPKSQFADGQKAISEAATPLSAG